MNKFIETQYLNLKCIAFVSVFLFCFISYKTVASENEVTQQHTEAAKASKTRVKESEENALIVEPFMSKKNDSEVKSSEAIIKLDRIDRELQFLKGKATEKKRDWVTPTLSLVGVFLGVIAGGIVNHKLQMSQKRFEICKSLMDWKVKQLSELYGPLHALLHQSSALYRHMNNVLITSDSHSFRLKDDPAHGDFDHKIFQIHENNEWKDFRTVTHISIVYGKNFKIEQYFDEIVKIGERMVEIIEDKAGYVREDQIELAEIFGQYLAHYAVLRKIHEEARNSFNNQQNSDQVVDTNDFSVDVSAAFPRDIQKLVQKGYQELNTELNSWGEQGNMKTQVVNS